MEHNLLDLETENEVKNVVLYQKDNNLDKRDNLDELPTTPSVYAICGRVNGQPANPRYVGESDNLQETIKKHFLESEKDLDDCVKEFVLSIKTKSLIYQEMPGSSSKERNDAKEAWETKYKPECNEALNKVH